MKKILFFQYSQVESCLPGDVTWALGYDSTAWVYTGGWGGGHFKVLYLAIFIIT